MRIKNAEVREVWGGERWPEGSRLLPAARLVPVPTTSVKVARRLGALLVAFGVFAAFAPWQQNISGGGSVIAFAPDERPQEIQATISGQIGRWHVTEGAPVSQGDLLVELTDNDPDRVARLEMQREAAEAQLKAYQEQVVAYQERIEALERSQRAQIDAAEAEVEVARQSVQARRELLLAAQAQVETARAQKGRIEALARDGLASQRERELALLDATRAEATLQSKQAELRSAESSLQTRRAALERARASTEADLRSAAASLRSAETQVAGARAYVQDAASKLAQQQAQVLRAPRDGVVQRILVQQGGVQVSQGQTLAVLVPNTESRAVEVYVDGNDAALISPGRQVRIQFEGWPAVQFTGWPSVAVGTFGGTVAFVDPSDNGRGDFRVVVVPDPDDQPWPEARYLRQGTRAKGWVLLDTVRVGFEIWRQFNGFPPSLEEAPEVPGAKDKPKAVKKEKK